MAKGEYMKTIVVELRGGKFYDVRAKGEKKIIFSPTKFDLDGWHCEIDSYGDITCEYSKIEKEEHYIVTYTLTHEGVENVYTKKTNYPGHMLQERKVGKSNRNGIIYLLDLPKTKAKSAYFKQERKFNTLQYE